MRRLALPTIVAAVALAAAPASAQSDAAPRAAISFAGGAASSASTTGVTLGGALLFDVNDRLGVEAQGTYLDRGAGASAVNATGSLLINLLPARQRVVPYAAVGGGVYRAAFDLDASRFMGPVGGQFAAGTMVCPAQGTGMGPGPGAGFGPGTGTCTGTSGYWGVGQMNEFYASRLGPMMVPSGGGWGTRSFVDPVLTLGGGVRFHVTDQIMIRPDVRAATVFANGNTHTVALFGVNVGYRF